MLIAERTRDAREVGDRPAAIADTAVNHEHRLGDECRQRHPVKRLVHALVGFEREGLVGWCAARPRHALQHGVLEAFLAHDLALRAELVVAAHQHDASRVHGLECEEEQHRL